MKNETALRVWVDKPLRQRVAHLVAEMGGVPKIEPWGRRYTAAKTWEAGGKSVSLTLTSELETWPEEAPGLLGMYRGIADMTAIVSTKGMGDRPFEFGSRVFLVKRHPKTFASSRTHPNVVWHGFVRQHEGGMVASIAMVGTRPDLSEHELLYRGLALDASQSFVDKRGRHRVGDLDKGQKLAIVQHKPASWSKSRSIAKSFGKFLLSTEKPVLGFEVEDILDRNDRLKEREVIVFEQKTTVTIADLPTYE